jgi:hypothetical protein
VILPWLTAPRFVVAILLSTVAPTAAQAQVVTTFDELSQRLRPGQTVTVFDVDGARVRGRLLSLTGGEIAVRSDVAITIGRNRVRQITRCCDPVRNGALIGGIALGVVGFMSGVNFAGRTEVGDGLMFAAMLGSLGAGVGAGVDALIRGDVVVYRAGPIQMGIRTDTRRRAVLMTLAF